MDKNNSITNEEGLIIPALFCPVEFWEPALNNAPLPPGTNLIVPVNFYQRKDIIAFDTGSVEALAEGRCLSFNTKTSRAGSIVEERTKSAEIPLQTSAELITSLPPSAQNPDGPQEKTKAEEVCRFDPVTGELYITDGTYHTVLTNYDVRPLKKIRRIGRNREEEILIEAEVLIDKQRQERHLFLTSSMIASLPTIIRKHFPEAYDNPNADKISKHLCARFSKAVKSVPTLTYIMSVGWCIFGGIHIYAHDGLNGEFGEKLQFKTDKSILCNKLWSQVTACGYALEILHLSNDLSKILPLVLFAHLGLLWSLFDEAGKALKFLLFIYGVSGSLKTEVSKVIFNIFNADKPIIHATFKDTSTALEIKMGEFCDSVLLLDDFHPAISAKEKSEMFNLLERVTRMFGDNVPKSRSTSDLQRQIEYKPHGLCAITGEDTAGTQSSYLRFVLVEVRKQTYDGKLLAKYQKDPLLWTTHLNHFVRYVGQRYNVIVEDIRHSFDNLREKYQGFFKEKRLVDAAVCLVKCSEILLEYAYSVGLYNQAECHSTFCLWEPTIINLILQSEELSRCADFGKMYLYAIKKLYETGGLSLAVCKELFEDSPNRHQGYIEKEYWFLEPDAAYRAIVQFWNGLNKHFSLSQEKVHSALYELNAIKVQYEKRDGRTKVNYLYRTTLRGRPRFLAINVDQMEKILEDAND